MSGIEALYWANKYPDEIKGIVKESKSEDGITFKPLKYQITEISYNDKFINSIEDDRLPLSQILYVISLFYTHFVD